MNKFAKYCADGIKVRRTIYYPIETCGYEVDGPVRLRGENYGAKRVHFHEKDDSPESLRKPFSDGTDSLRIQSAPARFLAPEPYLGQNINKTLTAIEKKYNNEGKYRLHYMTTREVFDVIKTAEMGLKGNHHDNKVFRQSFIFSQT